MNLKPMEAVVALLPDPFVIEILGADAAKVVNNLSTNEVLKLSPGDSVETFVTDVRGWVVAHALVLRQAEQILLMGSHSDPSKICQHIDRYIIRENATVADASSRFSMLAATGPMLEELGGQLSAHRVQASILARNGAILLRDTNAKDTEVPGVNRTAESQLLSDALNFGATICPREEFDLRRINNFWPIGPADISDKTIPQELDRDVAAISFTKGCYLGQETVARLDARGQLQKKLCRLEIVQSSPISLGAAVFDTDKQVGTICSSAVDAGRSSVIALAMLRRGYFTPGTELTCESRAVRILPNVAE